MKKSSIPKVFSLFLTAILVCALFAGCKSGPSESSGAETSPTATPQVSLAPAVSEADNSDTMRVLIDLQFAQEIWIQNKSTRVSDYSIRNAMQRNGWTGDFAFEFLPNRGQERENALERMRIEIMAGKGPDVFVLSSTGMALSSDMALFPYPEQMMKRHTFLPLDDYIENAKFMEWDKLIPQVMEAGRNDEGQQILPLAYSIPVTIFDAEQVQHEHSASLTFQDMVESDDTALRLAAAWPRTLENNIVYNQTTWRIQSLFPRLADYQTEELAFTKEELLSAVNTQLELAELWNSTDRPAAFQERLRAQMTQEGDRSDPYFEGLANPITNRADQDMVHTMIPIYNTQGGCTAVVTRYIAINRNTKYPDDAFLLVDYMMSKECKRTSFYEKIFSGGLPVYRELVQPGEGIVGLGGIGYYMHPENYDELQSLIDSITGSRFRDQLDVDMAELEANIRYRDFDPAGPKTVEELVDEAYRLMRMKLLES